MSAAESMRYASTRGDAPEVGIEAALVAGLAPDGGLYVPVNIPTVALPDPSVSLAGMAARVLAPYLQGSTLQPPLEALCTTAFAFDAPLRPLTGQGDFLLELFHGPTAAFKDYAARFLAAALEALRTDGAPPTAILVATSGDTGAAVAAAFHRRPGFEVVSISNDGTVAATTATMASKNPVNFIVRQMSDESLKLTFTNGAERLVFGAGAPVRVTSAATSVGEQAL